MKLGRKNGPDTPENWYFIVGEDPGNKFYNELYKRVARKTTYSLNAEHSGDVIEGLFGLYHGFKRIRMEKRQAIATHIGNVMHWPRSGSHMPTKRGPFGATPGTRS